MRSLVLIVGVVFCVAIAVVAVRWGLADRHADVAFEEMKGWADGRLTEDSWQLVHGEMIAALELDPSNPTYLNRLGRLSIIRMAMKPNRRTELGREGLAHLEKSIHIRGQWPLTWSTLAILKDRLGEYDGRFNEALINATVYGPWEPDVHVQIAGVGVRAWHVLPEESRLALMDNLDRGLRGPVKKAPAAVADAIKNNISGADVEFVRRFGSLLVEAEWVAGSRAVFADLSLTFWDVFSLEQRRMLAVKVADVAARGRGAGLLNRLRKEGRMSSICPLLPRDQKFVQFCTDKRLNFSAGQVDS